MSTYLFKCNHCGKIFKLVELTDKRALSDFEDVFTIKNNKIKCINCKKLNNVEEIMHTESWIADLFFRIKGK